MLPDSEGHGSDWGPILLRKPAANPSQCVCGLVILELEDLPFAQVVQTHFSRCVQNVALTIAQTDVGDAPFWVAEKRNVVHLASFRLHLAADFKLLAGVPRHTEASQSGGQGHQSATIKPPSAPSSPMVGHMERGLRPSPHGRYRLRRRSFVGHHLDLSQMPTAFMLPHA